MKSKSKKYNKKIDKKINPFQFSSHFMKFSEWLEEVFEIQKDKNGNELFVKCTDSQGNDCSYYVIKRKAELWMICLTALINFEMALRNKQSQNKNSKNELQQDFVFYGSYNKLRNIIINNAPKKLRPQLTRSITLQTISTSLSRIASNGYISIEYNHDVKHRNAKDNNYFRAIKLNYAKIVETSDISLSAKDRTSSQAWKKYKRCSREHRWMVKRPVTPLIVADKLLSNQAKKREIIEKMEAYKLKFKTKMDLFKCYILHMQKFYTTNDTASKYLTAIKSKEEEHDEILDKMYMDPDTGELSLSPHQESVLNDFYERIE